mmetsp:Transcript_35530/g.100575  ORF Transcript_35530/g.100575 Transcript_35530/m.100575 type:complete len:204 (-) Transcript_35530:548-1159(-)
MCLTMPHQPEMMSLVPRSVGMVFRWETEGWVGSCRNMFFWPLAPPGVVCKVAGLQAIGEGHPCDVSKHKHEPKAVRRDVHGRENGRLIPQPVDNIDQMEGTDQDHAVGDVPELLQLRGSHAQVQHHPSNEPGVQLEELLQVQAPNAWVQLPPDEEVVESNARVPPGSQELPFDKGGGVEIEGQRKGEAHRAGEDLQEVAVHPG